MIPAGTRVFVCGEPQDMRRSFDGLAVAAREVLGLDVRDGALFVFINKRRNRAKILWFEGNHGCILYKRLHRARFARPESGEILPAELAAVLRVVPTRIRS